VRRLLLPALCLLAPSGAFADTQPVQVKVLTVGTKQPCKCEKGGEVKASKVISSRCFLSAKVDPQQAIEPFSKMFLLMNDVLAKDTLVQVPDAGKCDFKPGKTVKMWITDTDPGFLQTTPLCGHEPAEYAATCEPYGRFMTFFRNENLKPAAK
jgi:hypothetical protein